MSILKKNLEKESSILTNYASSSNLHIEKGSPILSNHEKSLVIANQLHVSNHVLKSNKLDYLISAEMPSKEDLSQKYISEIETVMNSRGDIYQGDLIDLFLSADPSPNRKYVVWIIKSYLRGGIKRLEDLRSRTLPALENFIILSNRKKLEKGDNPWENEYDINNYFGLSSGEEKNRIKMGLEDIISKHEDFLESLKGKKETKEISKENLVITFENDLATVYQPLTEEASCYIGKGTRWCTAADKNNMFESYFKKGPIFVIQPKNPKYPGEKYQYHHEEKQYMDEKDEEVDPFELFERFGLEFEILKMKKIIVSLDRFKILYPKYPDANLMVKLDSMNQLQDLINYPYIKGLLFKELELTEIPDLKMFTGLKELHIQQNRITKIENLPDSITHLDLSDNQIKEIENLPDSLTILNLLDNQITKIENLPNSITDLDLYANQIKVIENLPNSITHLDLGYNKIKEIENLPPSLTKLYLGYNKIKEIENLPDSLTILNLLDNQITKIENLPDSLTILYLNHNQITKIENLPDSLRALHLYDNQITNKNYSREGLEIDWRV